MFFGALSPSSPDLCSVVVCVLLLVFVWLVSPTPCFLFFSLSLRRWGNPSPLGGVGFGVPFVFLRLGRALRPRSEPVLVRVFARFWSWCCLVSPGVGLGRSVFRLFVVVGNGLACASVLRFALLVCIRSKATPVDRPQWRPTPCRCGLRRPGLPVSCWESTLGRSDPRRLGGGAPL